MLKRNAHIFEGFFVASDLLVVSLAWAFSYWLRFASGVFAIEKGIPAFGDYLKMLFFVWLIWAFVFRRLGLYRSMRGTSRFREIWLIVKANLFAVILLLAVTYLFREKSVPFSRLVFVIFWAVATGLTVVSRSVIRGSLRAFRAHGHNLRYALIVGAGELAGRVAMRMHAHREYGLELVGCLTNPDDESNWQEQLNGTTNGITNGFSRAPQRSLNVQVAERHALEQNPFYEFIDVVGIYEDLPRYLAQGNIDQVIVALPLEDSNWLKPIISSVGDSTVDLKIFPDFYQFVRLGTEIEEFDGMPVVNVSSTPLSGFGAVQKRVLDVLLAATGLVVLAPLMLIIALAIKLTARGPVFFVQERVGIDGERFNMYKFRTMRSDAEAQGARFATRGDTRVTAVGRILRRFNLDELPQLVNVLSGDMSLVGPRPERPVFTEEFRKHIPRYMLRHKVQAGMTGWAQVNGWRGDTSIAKRIECDLYYIENWSLALDLKILGLTMWKGFRDRNAY